MFRRIAPALGLFFLAPLVAEFLLGNVSIDALPVGLVMAPMYGGGAVLIREVARRAGRGWATILLLATAFGVVEEGLVTQTLFNPSYLGFDLLRETNIPALGMGVWWTLFVLTLHTIWSICAPIAVVESFASGRAAVPWLRWPGLVIIVIVFGLGSALIFWGNYQQERFLASKSQLLGVVVAAIVLIVAAFAARQPGPLSERVTPGPWKVGGFSFLAASAFLAVRYVLSDWPIIAAYLLVYTLAAVMIVRWSGRSGWGAPHRLALAGGALLSYAWHSFPERPVIGSGGTLDLIGNATFTIGTMVLLALAGRNVSRDDVASHGESAAGLLG